MTGKNPLFRRKLHDDERLTIRRLWKKTGSVDDVAKLLYRHRSTIVKVLREFGDLSPARRQTWENKAPLDDLIYYWLNRKELGISPTGIARQLSQKHGMKITRDMVNAKARNLFRNGR